MSSCLISYHEYSWTTCSSKRDWQQWGEKLEETEVCVCTKYLFLIFKIVVLPKSTVWNATGYLQVSIMLFKPACNLWQLNILSWSSKCSIGISTKIKSCIQASLFKPTIHVPLNVDTWNLQIQTSLSFSIWVMLHFFLKLDMYGGVFRIEATSSSD